MTTDRNTQKKLQKWADLERTQLHAALKFLNSSPEGRTFLWWLFRITHTDSVPFTGTWGTTAFACGENNIGQQIKAELIDADPAGYVHLLQEKANERAERNLDLANTGDQSVHRDGPGDDDDPYNYDPGN